MTSRREFLQIGLMGAALVPVATVGGRRLRPEATFDGPAAPAPLYKMIFDERFPASVAFAQDASRRGIPVHGIRGDITALWYHDLYFQWKDYPAPLAGMTTNESLFCLEMLARDAGLRVTARRVLDERLVSWSIGPRV